MNALSTFREYLVDYASPATQVAGERRITKCLDIPTIGDVVALKPGDAAPSFELKDPAGTDPNALDQKSVWRPSTHPGGSPGSAEIE